MKKILFLMLGCFFLLCFGCSLQDQEIVETPSRPDIYWGKTWVIEERETHINLSPSEVSLEAFCLITYQGDEPVEDVRIIMASPLTKILIDDSFAETFAAVKAGDQINYALKADISSWKEKVPTGISGEKLINDFEGNSFVSVSWKTGEEEHSVQFFDYEEEHH